MHDEVEYLKHVVFTHTTQDGLDAKIKQLSAKNESTEKKMNKLTKELEKSQTKLRKLTRNKQETVEQNFKNYF